MKQENNLSFLEKSKIRFKRLKLLFSILSILMMLSHPLLSIYKGKGNLYINIAVVCVSLIYGFFWLLIGNKKAYKMNRIYKYSRLFLSLVSLLINAYSIYITSTNFSILNVLISVFMGLFWFLNVIYNILFDIVSNKINKLINKTKENITSFKEKRNKKLTTN